MRQLRRWVPGPAPNAVDPGVPPVISHEAGPSVSDLEFCSKLAFHGGTAISEKGFGADAELIRLRNAGLLEIQRERDPPFAVKRVSLSQEARVLLAAPNRAKPIAPPVGDPDKMASMPDSKQDRLIRRHGFEVARGMISAAVKAELAAWSAEEQGGEIPARPAQTTAGISNILETRILRRISQIAAPFFS